MDHTASAPDEGDTMNSEPYVRLPKPMPRWMRPVIAVHTAVEYAFVVFALFAFLAGTTLLLIRAIP